MYTISLLLLALFSIYIGVFSFWRWDASWLRNLDTVPAKFLFVLVFALFLCAALLLLRRLIRRLSEKNLKRLALLCMLLLAGGQLLFLALIQPQLRYDPLKIFDMAVEMLRTHTISGTYETGYFARYTNNYPLTILTYWFLLLLSKLGVPESWFMPAVQIVNIVCITLSIWLGYRIAKELKGRLFATFFLVVCVLCPLSYVWAGYYYTATCSMPCLMGILYLYLRIRKAGVSESRRKVLLFALLGLIYSPGLQAAGHRCDCVHRRYAGFSAPDLAEAAFRQSRLPICPPGSWEGLASVRGCLSADRRSDTWPFFRRHRALRTVRL